MRPAILAAALLACATDPSLAGAREVRAGPYALEVVGEDGQRLPAWERGGQTWVLGRLGERYLLRIRNGSDRRIEVVASVDGRDVIDGRPAAMEKRGYLVDPHGELSIDGFRLSTEAVAAFRFSSVADSYAARMGDARDLGVIGLAVFPERVVRPRRVPYAADPLGSGAEAPSAAPGSRFDLRERKAGAESADAASRPGLGTEFGEEHGSHVDQVPFERASARPAALLSLRYDDERGLLAQGIEMRRGRWGEEPWRRRQARPFPASFAEPPPGW